MTPTQLLRESTDKNALIKIMRAISGAGNSQIIAALFIREPQTVGELAVATDTDLTTASHRLAVLRRAGIVKSEKKGKQRLYSLV